MDDREHSVQYFLDLIKKSHRGKFKVYIGMIAGVGMPEGCISACKSVD